MINRITDAIEVNLMEMAYAKKKRSIRNVPFYGKSGNLMAPKTTIERDKLQLQIRRRYRNGGERNKRGALGRKGINAWNKFNIPFEGHVSVNGNLIEQESQGYGSL